MQLVQVLAGQLCKLKFQFQQKIADLYIIIGSVVTETPIDQILLIFKKKLSILSIPVRTNFLIALVSPPNAKVVKHVENSQYATVVA